MAARKRKEEVGVGFKFPPAGWREDEAILWIKSSTVQDRARIFESSTAVDRDDVRIKRVGLIISGHNNNRPTFSRHTATILLHRSTAPPLHHTRLSTAHHGSTSRWYRSQIDWIHCPCEGWRFIVWLDEFQHDHSYSISSLWGFAVVVSYRPSDHFFHIPFQHNHCFILYKYQRIYHGCSRVPRLWSRRRYKLQNMSPQYHESLGSDSSHRRRRCDSPSLRGLALLLIFSMLLTFVRGAYIVSIPAKDEECYFIVSPPGSGRGSTLYGNFDLLDDGVSSSQIRFQ